MSDPRAIGVFDSGTGGLTVLHEVRRALPSESTVYLGDLARLPYGPRPQEEVRVFSHEIARFLLDRHDVKLLVIACNTASAAALTTLRALYPALPIVGVIEPGAHAAVAATRNGRVGVFATEGTVRSAAYPRAVRAVAPAVHVVAQACPALVPLAEAGETNGAHVEAALRGYLAPLDVEGVDTLILGCTHYPLLRPAVDAVVDGRLAVVDSAHTTAAETAVQLDALGLRAPVGTIPAHRLYTTGSPAGFHELAVRLFGDDVERVEEVDLSPYRERPYTYARASV